MKDPNSNTGQEVASQPDPLVSGPGSEPQATEATRLTTSDDDDSGRPKELDDQSHRLPFARLMAAYLCLCMAYFISYLDMNSTIVSLPTIADALHTGPSITWVGTAYLLGQTSCQPLYGRMSDIVGRKPILLFSIGCISVGGLLCGFSQSALWLFLCRAISGVGGGGISSLVAIIVSDVVSLRSRGKYQGFISLAIGTGAASGPFVAASLIQKSHGGWRWAFWVPSICAACCFFLLLIALPQKPVRGSWKEKVRLIDWFGVATSVAGVVLVALPIASGGSLWPWKSPRVITTLVFGVILLSTFLLIERYFAKIPIIPLRLFKQRSAALLLLMGFCHDFVWQSTQYFVPLYFQTVCGYTTLESATLILPFLLAQGLAGAASGPVMSKIARYSPVLRIGFVLWTIAVGLKQLFHRRVSVAVYVVSLAIEGAGVGWVHQPGLVALQANSKDYDRAVATGTRNVLRSLGGVIGVAVSTAVYYVVLDKGLQERVPSWLRSSVLDGTWTLGSKGTEEYESAILDARMHGFKIVFLIQIPLMALCLIGSFFVADIVLKGDSDKVNKMISRNKSEKEQQEQRLVSA